jgi:hypothetical protein
MHDELQKKHLLTDCFSSFDVRTSELHLNALYNNKERAQEALQEIVERNRRKRYGIIFRGFLSFFCCQRNSLLIFLFLLNEQVRE